MKKMNKLVALLLAAVMVLGMMPVSAHAAQHDHAHTHGIEEYPVLALDTATDVNIANPGDIAYFAFTPETTDLYHFYAQVASYLDTYGVIYDAEMNLLEYNDDAPWGNSLGVASGSFLVSYVLEAGKTYILAARLYNAYNTGAFSVMLTQGHEYESAVTKEMTCSEDGTLTWTCKHCGVSYEEAIPAEHIYGEDGNCTFCGEAYLIEGTCGDELTWKLAWNGTLTISGTGNMYNYSNDYSNPVYAPWYDYRYTSEENACVKKVVIEDGVTSIGACAFYNLGELVEVELADSITTFGDNAFARCSKLTEVKLPAELTAISVNCFQTCSLLENIEWNEKLTEIGNSAFYYCSGLKELALPEGITTLGKYAFASCYGLNKVTLPSTLTALGDGAFSYDSSLKTIIFQGDAPTFGNYMFTYVTADAWYPIDNETWTDAVKLNYNGTLTWKGLCSGSHTYDEPVTVPATCETGSYETTSCTVCGWMEVGAPNDDALGHDLIETVIPPNCGSWQYGRTEVTCTREGCNYYESKDWVPYQHEYEAVVTEATCTTDGYTTYTCTICTNYYRDNYVYATGHTVTEWSEPTAATCTEDGIKTGTCSVCDEAITEVVETALGHEWATEGTENEDGTTTYACTREGCDATYRTEGDYLYLGDNQYTISGSTGRRTKTFNATENGTLTITLKDGLMHNEYYYSQGWVSEYWQNLDLGWAFNYGMFNIYVNNVNTGFTASNGTVTLNAVEVNAGDEVTVEVNHLESSYYYSYDIQFNMNLSFVSSHTHEYEAVVTEPTCTEGGYTTYTCACGETYVDNYTDALGHSYEAVVTEPTCTESGYTTYTCACGDSYIADETAALGHTEGEAVVENEVEATCTTAGSYESVVYCSVCAVELSRETVAVDALGHDYQATEVVPPTCTKSGYTVYTCANCGDSYKDDPVEPEHQFDEGTVIAPTCTEMGCTVYTCLACGFEYEMEGTYVDALGHSWKGLECENCDATRENPFTDLDENVYSVFVAPIMWAVDNGITNGTGDGTTFSPTGKCSRAEVVTFLWRAAKCPEPTTTVNPFTDVNESHFFYKAVLWAAENGITTGKTADTFAPFVECNRAEVVTFLWRAMKEPASDAEVTFPDVQANQFYSTAVAWAEENGIAKGMDDGTFGVNTICNRAQVVTFLYRTYVD